MFQERMHSALRLLSRNTSSGFLTLSDFVPVTRGDGDQQLQSVQDVLSVLNPLGRSTDEIILLQQELPNTIPTLSLLMPRQFAMPLYTHRDQLVLLALRPTYTRKQMCTSFTTASHKLCNALASVAPRVCTFPIHSEGLSPFVVSGSETNWGWRGFPVYHCQSHSENRDP